MPKASDPSLFWLVKSLSNSEWKTLVFHFENNPWNPQSKKKEVQATQEYIRILRESDSYNKPEIMKMLAMDFDIKNDNKRYRDLKRLAEKAVFKAIELAPSNQTPKVLLYRLPILLPHLLGRGQYKKAIGIINNNLEAARNLEALDTEKKLLGFLDSAVARNGNPGLASETLEKSINRRIELMEMIEEIDLLTNIRNRLVLCLKLPEKVKHQTLLEVRADFSTRRLGLKSTKAKVLQAEIRRYLALNLGPIKDFVSSCSEIIDYQSEKPEHFEETEMINAYLYSLFAKAELAIREHRFEDGQAMRNKLLAVSKEIKGADREVCDEYLLLSSLQPGRVKLDRGLLEENKTKVVEFLNQYPSFIEKPRYLMAVYMVGEAEFLLGKYSSAIKWFYKLNNHSSSEFRPILKQIASFVIAIARVEMNDLDGLIYELHGIKKLIKGKDSMRPFIELTGFLLRWSKTIEIKDRTALLYEIRQTLSETFDDPVYSRIQNYFPFIAWIDSKLKSESFLDFLAKVEGPKFEF